MSRAILAALCGGVFICSTAQAETICAPRAAIALSLESEYAEVSVGRGLLPDGQLLELFLSVGGSFTVVATTVQGLSCVIIAGTDWEPALLPDESRRAPTRANR